jgi:hypothetical protein
MMNLPKVSNNFMRFRLTLIGIIVVVSFFLLPNGYAQAPTWSEPVDITERFTSNRHAFPITLCDPYQNIHIFWADHSEGTAAIYYRNDISGNLSTPVDILLSANPYYLLGTISSKFDTIHLTWVDGPAVAKLYYSRAPISAADNAHNWLPPQMLDQGVFNSSVQVSPAGTVHILYDRTDENQRFHEVIHIKSEDDGLSWSDPTVIFSTTFSEAAYVRLETAVDGRGRIHIGVTLRSTDYGAFSEVGYIRSDENVEEWSEYTRIQNVPSAWQGVEWIAPYAFGDDEIHLTWHDPHRLHIGSSDGGLTWSEPDEILSLGAAFGGPNYLTQDSSGKIYALVAEINDLFLVPREDDHWGEPDPLGALPIDPHGQFITACQGNQLHATFWDRIGPLSAWYSVTQVEATHLPRQPFPADKQQDDDPLIGEGSSNTEAIESVQVTPTPEYKFTIPTEEIDQSITPFFPIAFSASAAIIFILLSVFLVMLFRTYR